MANLDLPDEFNNVLLKIITAHKIDKLDIQETQQHPICIFI
jgi:hypothetical protein